MSTYWKKLKEEQRRNWEPVWRECGLDKEMDLETFLSQPWVHLARAGQEAYFRSKQHGHRPLLPQQAKIAKRIRAMEMARDQRKGNILPVQFG